MFGGVYFGQIYPGGFPGVSGVRRILRGAIRFLNGIRSIRLVRS